MPEQSPEPGRPTLPPPPGGGAPPETPDALPVAPRVLEGPAAERGSATALVGGPTDDAQTLRALATVGGPEAEGKARRHQGLGLLAWIAVGWMALVVLAAILAPLLPLPDPVKDIDTNAFLAPPSSSHLLGTTSDGHDVLSMVVYGGRASLIIGLGSIFFGFMVGGFLGIVSGYFKGKIGGVIGSLLDIFLAFPQLVLALAIVSFMGQSIRNIVIALSIVSAPILARISRASTLTWSEREFVLAARAQGARHARIMWREILPNALPAMFSIALLGIAVVIVAEGGLAILGVGVKPPTPSWGNVINDGRSDLADAPWITLAPSAAIFFTVLALNYLGDVVRARFDVKESAL